MSTQPNIAEQLALAEASAWLVRLQGSSRTPACEAAFRDWLAEDTAHARAFARVTETWDLIPGAANAAAQPDSARPAPARPVPARSRAKPRRARFVAMAASLALLIAAGATSLLMTTHGHVYQTRLGEQRIVVLEDGTRITLNTDTRLSVDYRRDQRSVRMDHGEALFEVAKNPQRPFVVHAGGENVRALGTTFVVRSEADYLDVLLVEGRVQVSHDAPPHDGTPAEAPVVLTPGERLVQRKNTTTPALDHPPVDEMTAWRYGEVVLDNTTLAEAAARINRYSKTQVRLDDPHVGALRISGVFATRDPLEFANLVAKLHGLQVVRTKDDIVLRAGSQMH